MGDGMQGVEIGWGVLGFCLEGASCGGREFGEPIPIGIGHSDSSRGRMAGRMVSEVDGNFLRSASLQRQMCIGRPLWGWLSQIGVD